MKKIYLVIGIVTVLIIVAIWHKEPTQTLSLVSTYKDATYTINGQKITLKDGLSETEAAPNSASKITTRYFGNEVLHDFDGDGREDIAFLLTQEMGGSGTFFYVVVALNTANGYIGSEGFFLGDRVAPQTTGMGNGNVIIVNYADRKPDESFAIAPSIGKSVWLLLDPQTMQFGQVAPNFEGEADPARMTLDMKTWIWISTSYNDGTKIVPKNPGKFTITFRPDKTFSVTTDCNQVGGNYRVNKTSLSFSNMFSTEMYCPDSEESDFIKMLGEANNYLFTSRGEFVIDLKFDSGSMIFR